MANDLIGTQAANSYNNGPINYLVGSYVSNGPVQDTFDAETANVADVFLGITYVNCLLCHNGRGHLDQINLWGSNITRYQAWQLSSFMSHTQACPHARVRLSNANIYYWSLAEQHQGLHAATTRSTPPAATGRRGWPRPDASRASPATTCRRNTSSTAIRRAAGTGLPRGAGGPKSPAISSSRAPR